MTEGRWRSEWNSFVQSSSSLVTMTMCSHNISAKFDNCPECCRHFLIVTLEILKNRPISKMVCPKLQDIIFYDLLMLFITSIIYI